jgi:hypothetical protein
MLVYVVADDTAYRLGADLTTWTPLSAGITVATAAAMSLVLG